MHMLNFALDITNQCSKSKTPCRGVFAQLGGSTAKESFQVLSPRHATDKHV